MMCSGHEFYQQPAIQVMPVVPDSRLLVSTQEIEPLVDHAGGSVIHRAPLPPGQPTEPRRIPVDLRLRLGIR